MLYTGEVTHLTFRSEWKQQNKQTGGEASSWKQSTMRIAIESIKLVEKLHYILMLWYLAHVTFYVALFPHGPLQWTL